MDLAKKFVEENLRTDVKYQREYLPIDCIDKALEIAFMEGMIKGFDSKFYKPDEIKTNIATLKEKLNLLINS